MGFSGSCSHCVRGRAAAIRREYAMQLDPRNDHLKKRAPLLGNRARSYGEVIFRATCEATAMYVLVRSHPRGAYILSSMEQVGDGDGWQVSLRLPCGGYRCRYFADLGGTLVPASPADVNCRPVAMRRLDAIVYVRDRARAELPRIARHRSNASPPCEVSEGMRGSSKRPVRQKGKCNRDARSATESALPHNARGRSVAPRRGDA
jgi:hypothetical protein